MSNLIKDFRLSDLTKKILVAHIDPSTKYPEIILLGYYSIEGVSEHISRYILSSKIAHGVVLDCASGSCYGSSILRRGNSINWVISVDVNKDLLKYGKIVYNASSCVCADAKHLPFREQCFDSVISIETIEHIRDQKEFLQNIKSCLKRKGTLLLTTPNKLYSSPFLQKPLNPYHINEYYLGPLLIFLKLHSFEPSCIYGGRKATNLEIMRRLSGSFLKFSLSQLFLKPYFIDVIYSPISNLIHQKRRANTLLADPDPRMFVPVKLRATSNIILYQYFLIQAHKS